MPKERHHEDNNRQEMCRLEKLVVHVPVYLVNNGPDG
jgi:hypothetical protein